MSGGGKFVRAPPVYDDDSDNADIEDGCNETYSGGKYVRAPPAEESDQAGSQQLTHDSPMGGPDEYRAMMKKVNDLEKIIGEFSKANAEKQVDVHADAGGKDGRHDEVGTTLANCGANFRWDNIKPFPSGIESNKLWATWIKYIENFEIAASLSNVNHPVRRAQLLFLAIGDNLQGIVRTAKLRPSMDDPNCYEKFVHNIEEYLKTMTDASAEHKAFGNMTQEKNENTISFFTRLQEKAWAACYSPIDQPRLIRFQLIEGMTNRELAKAALMYGFQTDFIIQAATRDEAFQAGSKAVPEATSSEVNRLQKRSIERPRPRRNENERDNKQPMKRFQDERGYSLKRQDRCSRCNRRAHNGAQCPASTRNCNNCGKRGHFAATCRQKAINFQERRAIEEGPKDVKEQQINSLSLEDVLVECRLGSSEPIEFQIDSGADVNVLGGADWIHLETQFRTGGANLEMIRYNNDREIRAYASSIPMHIECAVRAEVEVVGLRKPAVVADFLVIKEGQRSLLGRSTASRMELLLVGAEINSFSGLGPKGVFPKMPGVKVKFCVDTLIPAEKNAYYNVPAAYREGARQRLQEMQDRGIIEKVTTAPSWISGMSAVAKGKDDFRLVVNMRAPNKAIKREYYRLPILEEMKTKLHGHKVFTKLDLSNAFYHLELAAESRELTTFLAENGMFRFTRLMFGVNAAPEIFQREMERILARIPNKIIYIDDVLVFGRTLEELRVTVAEVLKIFKDNNLTLNTSKCEFDKESVKFLGHQLDSNGFHIDDSKIRDILKFRKPTTSSELRSFLGLASFISPYIQSFADISSPLWAVSSAKVWSWGPDQDKAFELLKDRIVHCTTTLGYFSLRDKTILYTDASPTALGAVLVQESDARSPRIISFASKALTSTERKYAQNQREALAAVWAVEHFSYYLLGRTFTLRTDASGITFILNRNREDSKRALTRADGWALRLTPYRYEVEYVRGSENIADPSSRLYHGVDEAFNDNCSPWEIGRIEANQPQFLTEQVIRDATARDVILLKVMGALESGVWSKEINNFKSVASELHNREGILVKNGCAVVPQELRRQAMDVAHQGHPLAAKFKSILRARVWWPGITRDAEEWTKSCAICAVNGKPERTTPMLRTFSPKAVWDTIAMDFNGPYIKYGGISILVIIDYRSRFAIARAVKSTNFESTRKILDDVFSREGFPNAIKSDNGPPFNGDEYKKYCADRGIQTVYSTPGFPQQNGLAESFMKIVNKAMSTASSEGTNYLNELQAAVNAYNASAHSITKIPPEEVLLGRKVKRGLPLLDFGKSEHDHTELDKRDVEAKLQAKLREDLRRGARRCRVKPGDTVIIERTTRSKGESRFYSNRYTVLEEQNGSLTICDESGQTLRRHISQVKKVAKWRESETPDTPDTPEPEEATTEIGIKNGTSSESITRPARQKRTPSYLTDYIKSIKQ